MINAARRAIARQARGIVHVNGQRVQWDTFEVVTQNFYQADSFRMELPLTGQPKGIDVDYWLSQPALLIEIFAGYPPNPLLYTENDLKSIFVGSIEQVKTERVTGTLTLQGRDLISKFIDNKIYDKYRNNTSSQIVEILAKKEGLTASVVPTKSPAGFYYDNDYVQNIDKSTSEWDLITYLAQKENYLAFMKGQVLYFIPVPDQNTNPYLLNCYFPPDGSPPTGNFETIEVSRDLTRARDVIVEVLSSNMRTGKPTIVRVRATPNKGSVVAQIAQPIGDAQVFSYEEANLSPQQALEFAQQKIKEITQHERLLEFTDAANDDVQKDSVIQLKGYSPSADQIYFPDSITRNMSMDSDVGYSMSVTAKNHSPNSVKLIA